MNSIDITFPDGITKPYPSGITGMQIAQSIALGLAKKALAVQVNGETWDLSRPIIEKSSIKIITWEDQEGKQVFWHSSAHLMAEALEALFPGIKLGIGPPIENGFYYDIDFGDIDFGEENLADLEKKMVALATKKSSFIRYDVSKQEALDYFTHKDDEYKLELLHSLKEGTITLYEQGGFKDLCRGPHLPNTGWIKAVKLLNVAGAYWRGDEKNKMLTRIYGITFPKHKDLETYLALIEEAKKRDHRKLGKQMELFAFSENVGMGLPLWLPKGAIVRDRLEQFMRKAQTKAGYLPVITPHIGSKQLYVTSGHYEKYAHDSFQLIHTPDESESFMLKPMNCPHHCEIYKIKPRSYKELPLRFAEFGTVYRYEQSGELHGLTRVRGFTQDDAHIFCTEEQVKTEFMHVIDLVLYIFKALDFQEYTGQISLRDPHDKTKYIGDDALWERAEKEIQEAAKEKKIKTTIVQGEAAFYGPKLDFMVNDALGRKWQLGTIQVDYQLPRRFGLTYIGADNRKHVPVMIHRAPFGSIERFLSILIEHCAGNFPLWLVPDQCILLPISEKYNDYAYDVKKTMEKKNIRVVVDGRDEKIGRKILDAETQKIPFMLVVGQKEVDTKKLAVREKGKGNQGLMSQDQFFDYFFSKKHLPPDSQTLER